MDVFDDDNDNPFDFVGQFKKLQQERKNKASSTVDLNQTLDQNQQISNNKPMTICLDDTEEDNTSHISANSFQSSASKRNTRLQQRNKRKNCESENVSNVIGPVICIGDFDDDYNMPPPKLPAPKVNPEYNYLKSMEQDSDKMNKQLEEEASLAKLNHVRNIKVYWRKMKTYRFPLRMFQSIESIYEYFAKLEDIKEEFVSLELNNKVLSPSDTPHSINYKITDFIAGDIVYYRSPFDTPKISESENKDETTTEEEIQFRIIQKDVKHPLIMTIKKTEKMQILYFKLSEKLGLDINSFTLEFDGDKIKVTDSIESLDLEGDECFELYKKSKF